MMKVVRKSPRSAILPWIAGAILAGGALGACGAEKTAVDPGEKPDAGAGGAGGDDPISVDDPGVDKGPFNDFPKTPILDAEAGAPPPPNAGDLFGPAGSGDPSGGPCLLDPAPGTLFPSNWPRPRFAFAPGVGQNLFEIRIKAPGEINELIVYTRSTAWKMPLEMWKGLSKHQEDVPIAVSVRGAVLQGNALVGPPRGGAAGEVQIAPAAAAGSIIYWRTDKAHTSGELKGFTIGDESVFTALKPSDVPVKAGAPPVECIGCHTSTPGGRFVAVKALGATGGDIIASVRAEDVGEPPSFWSTAAMATMSAGGLGVPSFSGRHFSTGDRVMITSYSTKGTPELAWFDLEATASGQGQSFDFMARTGDAKAAIMPSFSHDGTEIVYISATSSQDGRPTSGDADLYSVPYNGRKGGAATPIPGASDPAYSEYYPSFSPDDKLIAFNRVDAGVSMYSQHRAEVFVLPAKGGIPLRIAANDPVACSGLKSPGVTNSWPKWAPAATVVGDRTFYWLTFSSTRSGGLPQLFATGIVVQGGKVTTYPALYFWNQPSDEPNHTPAWEVFDLGAIK